VDHDQVARQRGQDESAAPGAGAGGEREPDGDEQRAGVEDEAREERNRRDGYPLRASLAVSMAAMIARTPAAGPAA
jgi:hypothetical protein